MFSAAEALRQVPTLEQLSAVAQELLILARVLPGRHADCCSLVHQGREQEPSKTSVVLGVDDAAEIHSPPLYVLFTPMLTLTYLGQGFLSTYRILSHARR